MIVPRFQIVSVVIVRRGGINRLSTDREILPLHINDLWKMGGGRVSISSRIDGVQFKDTNESFKLNDLDG